MTIDDFIDFHVLFMTMCIIIAYKYVTTEKNLIFERKNI